jgi:hypothetical protein
MTDIQYFDDLYTDFEQIVVGESQRGSLSAATRESSIRRRSSRRGVRLGVVASICLTATALGVALERSHETQTRGVAPLAVAARVMLSEGRVGGTPSHDSGSITLGLPVPPVGADPFIDNEGEQTTVAEASKRMGVSIEAPSSALASSSLLSAVWYNAVPNDSGGQDQTTELAYKQSGIRVDYTIPPAIALNDPQSVYERMAADLPGTTVETVHGVPALVLGQTNGQPGFVDMVLDGVHIVVMGNHTADDLIAVAGSIPGTDAQN